MSIKICAISDTHGQHDKVIIPQCHILLHAGDFTTKGSIAETKAFFEWFSRQPAKHRIFCSGNHDFLDQDQPELFKELLKEYPSITYLRDEGVTVEGISIWGRPWTPEFCGWAFMADPESPKMLSTLSIIPEKVDILLTHGPAYGILDLTKRQERVGCKDLLNELDRIQCKYLIFGHIHESHGQLKVKGTEHMNVSSLNEFYHYKNPPKVFDYK